jgi:hypothetical protein
MISFLYLSQKDVRDTGVDMGLALAAVEDAFKLHHRGEVVLPHKVVLDMDERKRGRGNAMPGYVGGEYHTFGIKWIAGFPGNPARFGLPRGTGLTILNDAENGLPLAVMDCTLLSAMRTGAVTGVGARALARPDSASVAMIGTGVQARTQLEALKAVLPGLKEVRAYDLRREAAEAFAAETRARHGLEARAVGSAEEAVRGADVVVTVTVAMTHRQGRLDGPRELLLGGGLLPGGGVRGGAPLEPGRGGRPGARAAPRDAGDRPDDQAGPAAPGAGAGAGGDPLRRAAGAQGPAAAGVLLPHRHGY